MPMETKLSAHQSAGVYLVMHPTNYFKNENIMNERISQLLTDISNKTAVFSDVLSLIDSHYSFTETAFDNGSQKNQAGENSGSCKVFSFAKLQGLSAEDTMKLFAEHYDNVCDTPDGDNHQNIRQFMKNGWDGIAFSGNALTEK